jgi:CPA1 family monovalent cation:H+ antiporter
VSYLAAEELHVSGVLAVVSTGLFIVVRSSEIFTHQTRLQSVATWNTVVFLLNGIVFILIGLQLPAIMEGIRHYSWPLLLGYGGLVSGAVIWGASVGVPRRLRAPVAEQGIRERRRPPTCVRSRSLPGRDAGRGVAGGGPGAAPHPAQRRPLPAADLILFLTFCVILSTLVLQGSACPS